MCKKVLLAVLLVTAVGMSGTALAQPYVDPGDITATDSDDIWGYVAALSSDWNDLDFTNPADPISTFNSLNYWLSNYDHEPFSVTYPSPASGNDVFHWVRYDFSAPATLDRMMLWNGAYPGYPNRCINQAEVYYTADSGATWSLLTPGVFTAADGTAPRSASDIVPFGGLTVDAVVIDIISCYYSANDPFNYCSIQQVLFDGEVIPEPTTMVLLGLGSLAMLRRKRAA